MNDKEEDRKTKMKIWRSENENEDMKIERWRWRYEDWKKILTYYLCNLITKINRYVENIKERKLYLNIDILLYSLFYFLFFYFLFSNILGLNISCKNKQFRNFDMNMPQLHKNKNRLGNISIIWYILIYLLLVKKALMIVDCNFF